MTDLHRRIWYNRYARQAIKAIGVGGCALALVYALQDPKIPRYRTSAEITSSDIHQLGGLSINGVVVPYEYRRPVSCNLRKFPSAQHVYDVRFTRTSEHPIDQLVVSTQNGPVISTRTIYFKENATQEIILGGEMMPKSIQVITGEHTYTLQFP